MIHDLYGNEATCRSTAEKFCQCRPYTFIITEGGADGHTIASSMCFDFVIRLTIDFEIYCRFRDESTSFVDLDIYQLGH